MPPRLADRLRTHLAWLRHEGYQSLVVEEAAAALDRTEALEQAAQAWAKAIRHYEHAYNEEAAQAMQKAREALLALLPALSGGDPQ